MKWTVNEGDVEVEVEHIGFTSDSSKVEEWRKGLAEKVFLFSHWMTDRLTDPATCQHRWNQLER
ncbi:MAG: hypothetical protein U5S82_13455 [Gammaproteobacteria bacterium]|nr:hypothetical protein [Gammaproteobacteria bacterium]